MNLKMSLDDRMNPSLKIELSAEFQKYTKKKLKEKLKELNCGLSFID